MGSKDITVTTLDAGGGTLRLTYRPQPRNAAMLIAVLIVMCLAVLLAFWWREPDAGGTLAIIALVLGVTGLGLSLLILRGARLIGVTTTFDVNTRLISIVRETRGQPDSLETLSFDDVSELRVLQQKNEGTQIETMSIVTGKGPQTVIAVERRYRAYSTKPSGTPLKDLAGRIAAETGLPRGKRQSGALSGAAAMLGIRRS